MYRKKKKKKKKKMVYLTYIQNIFPVNNNEYIKFVLCQDLSLWQKPLAWRPSWYDCLKVRFRNMNIVYYDFKFNYIKPHMRHPKPPDKTSSKKITL